MARPLLLDTTVFIAAIRDFSLLPALRRLAGGRHCYLTAITVAELQAGARSPRQALLIEQLAALFDRDGRLLAPTAAEWSAGGRLIARAIQRRGAMDPRDHYPDVLIALLAGRIGAAVVTENVSDLRGWITLGHLDATVPTPKPS